MKETCRQSNGHYINGHWQKGEGEIFSSENPADNSKIWEGNAATEKDCNAAIQASRSALATWSNLPSSTRANYLIHFSKEIECKRQELSYLISLETGKPLWEAHTEVSAVISKIHLSIQAHSARQSEQHNETAEYTASLRYKPHGIVVVLGAFNFPAHLSNGHIVPALLAGNTVILKPSELTPAVSQCIVECWHDTGLPPGVLNCIQGGAAAGKALLAGDINGVYFTGSYDTGQKIHRFFGDKPEIILALEMGGNNPLIIHPELQDIDAAVYNTILSCLITSGQRCTAARRLFISKNKTGKTFLKRLKKSFEKIHISSFDTYPEPFMGPVISQHQASNLLTTQERLLSEGGKSILTATSLLTNTGFISPGIIDMSAVSNPVDEEIFGPLLQVYFYDSFEEAITQANRTKYGLVSGLIGGDETHYQHFFQNMRSGLINWNRPTTGAVSTLPFGGIGKSGNHRPSGYFAADYCAYPIASLEHPFLLQPKPLLPGIHLE